MKGETSGWLLAQARSAFLALIEKEPALRSLGEPTALATQGGDLECIDYLLTVDTQPIATFLTAAKPGGHHVTQELQLVFRDHHQSWHGQLSEYDLIKVLGTGGFS